MKLDEILSCGGAYVKLFLDGSQKTATDFDNETPYGIMFGPDRCGGTNKVGSRGGWGQAGAGLGQAERRIAGCGGGDLSLPKLMTASLAPGGLTS